MQSVRRGKFLVLLAFLILLVSAISLAACGTSHDASRSNKNPATLVGEWRQINASSNGWMTASISSGSIQVNLRGRDSSSIFWLGTFDTSRKPRGKFNIVSIGDQDAMRWDITASSEKKKTFSYNRGVLSFEFSAMGSSATIHMIKDKKAKTKLRPIPKWTTPSYNRPSPQKSSTFRTTPIPTVKKIVPTPKVISTKKK